MNHSLSVVNEVHKRVVSPLCLIFRCIVKVTSYMVRALLLTSQAILLWQLLAATSAARFNTEQRYCPGKQ